MSKVSTVTGMEKVGVAIPVTVIVFELCLNRCLAKVPTVTRMSVSPPKMDEPHLGKKSVSHT